jgi:Ala-tRNA(Pro) deacylase
LPAEKVRSYLMEHGIPYRMDIHQLAYTAQDIAHVEHIPEQQIAKAVMVQADDELVMAVVAGDRYVDLEKARKALGATTVRLAAEGEFSPAFPDCEKGAEPPFGALYNVATVVDIGLKNPQITFNAGTHTSTISMELSDYLALTRPKVVDIASA